jgi:hypothetical protein
MISTTTAAPGSTAAAPSAAAAAAAAAGSIVTPPGNDGVMNSTTTAAGPSLGAGLPVGEAVISMAVVESVLGSVGDLDVEGFDPGQLEQWLHVGQHGESSFAALQAKVLTRLRRLGDEDGRRIDPATVLTAGLGMASREARARVEVADTLAASPAAADALADGRISRGHADVFATRIPRRLRAEAGADPQLVAAAAEQGVDAFARTATEWTRRRELGADPDGSRRAARQHRNRKASVFTNDDGMLCLRADLPPDTGAIVAATLHDISEHKWRTEDGRTATHVAGIDPDRFRTSQQRLADALIDLARAWDPDGTSLGAGPGNRSTRRRRKRRRADTKLLVVVDHRWLTDHVAAAAHDGTLPGARSTDDTLPEGHSADPKNFEPGFPDPDIPAPEIPGIGPITPATLRRLACDAGILPIVMNGPSAVLDLGREQRTVGDDQWWALVVRDRGCVFPNCDRPPSWTEAHHIDWWTRDRGPTDLENLCLLCSRHHHLVHEDAWHIIGRPTTGLEFRPAHQRPGIRQPQPPPRPPRAHDPDIHPSFRQPAPTADQPNLPLRC